MKSVATRRFWVLFHALPREVQHLATKNYELWCKDPRHPSLHFRRLQGTRDLYTIRIGEHHRAIGQIANDTITWVWIGSHAEYDRLT
jgi:hypothetical protein